MLDAAFACGAALEIFARERTIDAERGTRAFGRRDDRELHITNDVARHKHARNTGRFVLPAKNSAVTAVTATEGVGESRLRA